MDKLPVELIPLVLQYVDKHLSKLCLVNSAFKVCATEKLYRWIRFYGKDPAPNLIQLFSTLVLYPHLSKLVKNLEIRVYPFEFKVEQRKKMESLTISVLEACQEIEELIWTRKGAITDSILSVIVKLPRLRYFEFNATTSLSPGSWNGNLLLELPVKLKSISLIMPDRVICNVLPVLLERLTELKELSILCRESPNLTDLSKLILPLSLSNLTTLSVAGCTRITAQPLLLLLEGISDSLSDLSLEALGLVQHSFWAAAAPSCKNLKHLKITHPGSSNDKGFVASLIVLLKSITSLESFTIYHSGNIQENGITIWPVLNPEDLEDIGKSSPNLRKFFCSGVLLNEAGVKRISENMPELNDLVIHIEEDLELAKITPYLSKMMHLETLHILSPSPVQIAQSALLINIQSFSPSLRQIGYKSSVFKVIRTWTDEVRISLTAYDSPIWPEALLIVRT